MSNIDPIDTNVTNVVVVTQCAKYLASNTCDDINKIPHRTHWENVIQKAVTACQNGPDALGEEMLKNKEWWSKKCMNEIMSKLDPSELIEYQ